MLKPSVPWFHTGSVTGIVLLESQDAGSGHGKATLLK